MIELGELEREQADFARRNTRVVVASAEGLELAAETQAQFPHLVVLADSDMTLINATGLLHKAASPTGEDAAAPTTFLIDRQGQVRWVFRPDRLIERQSAADLLAAVDRHLPK